MGKNIDHRRPTREDLCVNVQKVYDWVIVQKTVTQNVSSGDLSLTNNPRDAAITDLVAECYLTDSSGERLSPNTPITFTETRERENRPFVIDGVDVLLQNVSITKYLYVVIEFSGLYGTTPFIDRTPPIPIEVPESIYMCAPEGTDLVIRISDVNCSVSLNYSGSTVTSVDITLNLCQSVQAVADVTIEITADFCEPRDILAAETCPPPSIPPQCPVLFPG